MGRVERWMGCEEADSRRGHEWAHAYRRGGGEEGGREVMITTSDFSFQQRAFRLDGELGILATHVRMIHCHSRWSSDKSI